VSGRALLFSSRRPQGRGGIVPRRLALRAARLPGCLCPPGPAADHTLSPPPHGVAPGRPAPTCFPSPPRAHPRDPPAPPARAGAAALLPPDAYGRLLAHEPTSGELYSELGLAPASAATLAAQLLLPRLAAGGLPAGGEGRLLAFVAAEWGSMKARGCARPAPGAWRSVLAVCV
jgi:hypothetical protein